jgi:hypothetical protein
MDKWIFLIGSNCSDPEKEKEFNDWYDNVHLNDVLETPGFTGAIRYENTSPAEGEAKYLAVYQIETDDIDEFMKLSEENIGKKAEAGRISPLLRVVSRGLYKQIGALYK